MSCRRFPSDNERANSDRCVLTSIETFTLQCVVDDSLWNTTLQVIIMQGQLDVICNTAGAC